MNGKRRKRVCRILAVLLLLAGIGTGAYAALQRDLTLSGTLWTGNVEIELTQPAVNPKDLTPGQTIRYTPTVTAKGADCYVRLTVEIAMKQETGEPLTTEGLEPAKGWIWKGNTLYATEPFKTGETRKALEELEVPSDWTGETASDFQIHLTADSIQKAHVTPDFQSASPWGMIEVEEHKDTAHPEYRTVRKAKPEEITYVGNGLFEIPSGDLFSDFPEMLPGDTASDSIQIKNGTKEPIELSFVSVPQKEALLDRAAMKLSIGGETFYDGTLDGKGLESKQVLTRLEAGERTKLDYSVTLDSDFENAFSLEADLLTWKLEANEPVQAVQTGDRFPFYVLSAMLLCSGAFLLVSIAKRKEEKEYERTDERAAK